MSKNLWGNGIGAHQKESIYRRQVFGPQISGLRGRLRQADGSAAGWRVMSPTSFRVVRFSQRIALSNPGIRAHILWLTLKDRHGVPALSQQSGPCHAAQAAAKGNNLL
jgi:hypothetical protein